MMLTRCPGCQRVFRVAPPQLRVRQGQVRCGQCATAFNALSFLSEAEEEKEPETLPPPAKPPYVWMIAAIALLLTFAAQLTYYWRSHLAGMSPSLGYVLKTMCGYLHCEIPPETRAEAMKIEYATMRIDPQHPHLVNLDLTLRNDAPFAQPPPYLELSLTNIRSQVVVRRIITPPEYLEGPLTAIAPSSRQEVRVTFDGSNVPNNGFLVNVFYP